MRGRQNIMPGIGEPVSWLAVESTMPQTEEEGTPTRKRRKDATARRW